MWNRAFKIAYDDKCDYFLQCGDDIHFLEKDWVKDSIKILEKMQKDISSQNLTDSNSAISLAKWISGIPVIYYPWGLQSAAVRFKNSF